MPIYKAPFICIEGIEKAGKTTLVRELLPQLSSLGPVMACRAPGYGTVGEILRQIVLEGAISRVQGSSLPEPIHAQVRDPLTKELLHMADLRETLATHIIPALTQGITVVTDRFEDSTRAYAAASGVERYWTKYNLDTIVPALLTTATTHIYLSLPVEEAMERLRRVGAQDQADSFGDDFYRSVAVEYDRLYQERGATGIECWFKVDATQPVHTVVEEVREIVAATIKYHRKIHGEVHEAAGV